MSFSQKVKKELYPLQKNYFTLVRKKITIDEYDAVYERTDEDVRASIRGAFLVGGSITDPSKSYHFEIVVHSEDEAGELCSHLSEYQVAAHVHRRRNSFVVYSKDGSDIASILGIMGAHNALMDFENMRILNEMRGSVNRQVNCETANIRRTVRSSVRQIEAIRRIEESLGMESLPLPLREIADVRVSNPDASLAQLGELLHPPVGKSGVNHRLRKLMEIADQIPE